MAKVYLVIEKPTRWMRLRDAIQRTILFPDWGGLRSMGNSKVVRSNLYWMFLIPIVAKTVLVIQNNHHLMGPLGVLAKDLQLPFSWIALFLSSLAFSVGALVFIVRCPSLVKDVANFGEFEAQGRSDMEIKELYVKFAGRRQDQRDFAGRLFGLQEFLEYIEGTKENRPVVAQMDENDIQNRIYKHVTIAKRPDAFAMLWKELVLLYPYSRMVCSISYSLGLFVLGIVFVQNIWSVVQVATR
jgi:hypothetical protein